MNSRQQIMHWATAIADRSLADSDAIESDAMAVIARVSACYQSGAVPAETRSPHAGPIRWGHLYLNEAIECRTSRQSISDYRAYDPILDEDVILSLFDPNDISDDSVHDFVNRARLKSRVSHANLIRLYGGDVHNHLPGIWRQQTTGFDNADSIDTPAAESVVSRIASVVSDILRTYHEQELIHGSINLCSILYRHDTILLDQFRHPNGFDLSGDDSPHLIHTLAPELYHNTPATAAIDLYALGAICAYLLTGYYPVLDQQSDQPVPPARQFLDQASAVDESTRDWVARLLSINPEQRGTAAELHQALVERPSGGGEAGDTRQPARPAESPRLPVAYSSLIALLITALLALGVSWAAFWNRSEDAVPPLEVVTAEAETEADPQLMQQQAISTIRQDRQSLLDELLAREDVDIEETLGMLGVLATPIAVPDTPDLPSEADWQIALSEAYRTLGQVNQASEAMQRAAEALRASGDEQSAAALELERIDYLLDQGQVSLAEASLASGVLADLPDSDPLSATRLMMLGQLQIEQQRFEAAEQTFLSLMTSDAVHQDSGDLETSRLLAKELLAQTYHNQGRYRQAVRHRQQLLESMLETGTDHQGILRLRHDLVESLIGQGAYSEAVRVINDGLSEVNQWPDDNTYIRVRYLQQLAEISRLGGEMVSAQNFLERAMSLALEDEQIPAQQLIELRLNQAAVKLMLRDFDAARQLLRHNIVDATEQLGAEHILTLESQYMLGRYQIETGQFRRGEIQLRELQGRLVGEGQRQRQLRFDVDDHIALALAGQNNFLEAERLHLEVLAGKEAYYGPDHLQTLTTLERLADTLKLSGQLLNASESFSRVIDGRQRLLPQGHRDISRVERKLAALQ